MGQIKKKQYVRVLKINHRSNLIFHIMFCYSSLTIPEQITFALVKKWKADILLTVPLRETL